jgi:hypothetical protein
MFHRFYPCFPDVAIRLRSTIYLPMDIEITSLIISCETVRHSRDKFDAPFAQHVRRAFVNTARANNCSENSHQPGRERE